jgi:5-methylcytosine-specific restriction endonuclease McrA
MDHKRKRMPSLKQIRAHWAPYLVGNKGFDSKEEAMETGICFACGMWFSGLERAHINPLLEGGSNDVSNLHALCRTCHKDSEGRTGDEYFKWFNQRTLVDAVCSMAARSGANLHSLMMESSEETR